MHGEYSQLVDLLVILAVSIPVSFLFHRLRLPSIAGFLATGVIVGPYGAKLISDIKAVQAIAEIGVVLLLFTIGLEFSVRQLLSSGWRLLCIALGQVVLTILVVFGTCALFGMPASQGIFLGFLFSLSSTAIVLKILSERAEIDAPHGKISVSVLLFQDLCVIPMMLVVPHLSTGAMDFLQIGKQLLIAALAIGILATAAHYLVPKLLQQVVQIRNRDLFLVTILFLCLGTAYAGTAAGLSLAIGAFIAGLVISESSYSHQILSDILPFRDVFNAIFFISIGMLLDSHALLANLSWNLGIAGIVLVGKIVLLLVILLIAGTSFRVAWITAFGLSQVGEFSFLLAHESRDLHLLPDRVYQLFFASSVLTMFCTPFLFILATPLASRLQQLLGLTGFTEKQEKTGLKNHLIIIGFGLNGKNLARVVRDIGIPFIVIELNDKLHREAKEMNIPAIFGDATSKEVLHKAGAEEANMVVIAISDAAATRRCVAVTRALNSRTVILVRTRYVAEVESLMRLGANIVIPEEFETSVEIFARVLEQYQIPDHLIDQQISVIRSDTYGMLRGLSLTQDRLTKVSELFLKSTVQQIVIGQNSPARDKTLRQLDLRQKTGATVLAVLRGDQATTNPPGDFQLLENDIVVVWGAHLQLADTTRLLVRNE